MMKKKYWYYEVRVNGDGEFKYFVEPSESNYNPSNLRDCRKYAGTVNGYVVKVTVERMD